MPIDGKIEICEDYTWVQEYICVNLKQKRENVVICDIRMKLKKTILIKIFQEKKNKWIFAQFYVYVDPKATT